MKNRKIIILSVLLALSVGNFFRTNNTTTIRTVDFLSIFAIGAITGLLIHEIAATVSNKDKSQEK